MKWPWQPRWTIVIVGAESDCVTELSFLRFRRRREADLWALTMNRRNPGTATYFEVRPITQGAEPPL